MGWVRRPSFSRSKSRQFQSSLTVWAAKNSGVVRLAVASQVTALAPFSQNSNEEVCLGSGHAQPGQSKPWGWFMVSRPWVSLPTAIWPRTASATAFSAPQPAAAP